MHLEGLIGYISEFYPNIWALTGLHFNEDVNYQLASYFNSRYTIYRVLQNHRLLSPWCLENSFRCLRKTCKGALRVFVRKTSMCAITPFSSFFSSSFLRMKRSTGRKRCCPIIIDPLPVLSFYVCYFRPINILVYPYFLIELYFVSCPSISSSPRGKMGRKAVSIDKRKEIMVLHGTGPSHHEISRKLNISRHCIRQTIREFQKHQTVATKPGAGRPSKLTEREKRAIKLEQLRDDTLSLSKLVRFAHFNFNVTISRSTVSRILKEYGMISYIAPKQLRITPMQRRNRVLWCEDRLDWSIERTESNFVAFELIPLVLKIFNSEPVVVVVVVVVLVFGHTSHVMV